MYACMNCEMHVITTVKIKMAMKSRLEIIKSRLEMNSRHKIWKIKVNGDEKPVVPKWRRRRRGRGGGAKWRQMRNDQVSQNWPHRGGGGGDQHGFGGGQGGGGGGGFCITVRFF
uniref:Uncharacterized protein n=1 Tax=Glossina austeni TaxID=7395 RepID=A0A1A9UNY9_GLOAU